MQDPKKAEKYFPIVQTTKENKLADVQPVAAFHLNLECHLSRLV
jgi:hypothetical protein